MPGKPIGGLERKYGAKGSIKLGNGSDGLLVMIAGVREILQGC